VRRQVIGERVDVDRAAEAISARPQDREAVTTG
jgi:hypothetical protein